MGPGMILQPLSGYGKVGFSTQFGFGSGIGIVGKTMRILVILGGLCGFVTVNIPNGNTWHLVCMCCGTR